MKRLALAAALLGVPATLLASSSRVAVTAGARDFLAGDAKGTAVSADGRLTLGPPLQPRAWPENAADASVFAAAGDASGRVYVATGGGRGRLYVSDANGISLLFTAPEANLTAVAVAPDGSVACASSPNGKIYRVDPKAGDPEKAGTELGDPKEAAVWALAFAPDGTLYAGTGNKGRIYRKTPSGALELFHEIEDVHVRALLVGPDGTVYAGTSDRGLVVAIGARGAARTLYDSARPEVTGLALDGRGILYAAASHVDATAGRATPLDLRVRPTPTPTPAPAPHPGEEAPRGSVSVASTTSVSRPATTPASANNSEIVSIAPDGFVEPAWAFPEEAIFSLRFDLASGAVLVATGPRGRLYAWKDRAVRLLAQTGEKIVVACPPAGGGYALVTNTTSGVLRPAASPAPGSFLAAVKDASRLSTFGQLRWEGSAPAGSSVVLSVRSGNSEKPDATWSSWEKVASSAKVPVARFFQWKADLAPNGKGESPTVERVELTYAERNARPVLENLAVLDPGLVYARGGGAGTGVLSVTNPDENGIFAGLEQPREGAALEGPGRRLWRKGYRTLTWKGTDPNGDSLRYDVEARREGGNWFPIRKDVEDSFLSFDTAALADGRYRFRVTASDRVSQPEGDALTASEESPIAIVDNTPPVLKVETKKVDGEFLEVRILATDALSAVVKAEGSVNADRWRLLAAEDGAADSPVERFVLRVPKPAGPAVLAVRVLDAAGNVAAISVEWPW